MYTLRRSIRINKWNMNERIEKRSIKQTNRYMNCDCDDISSTNCFGMAAWDAYKGKNETEKSWKGRGKSMKERLKMSGRYEESGIGKKCQEELILWRQAFKWSL